MNRVVPDCLVTGYEHLIEGLDLPDPDDRHVLAAAIRANAQATVTLDSIDLAPGAVVQSVARLRDLLGPLAGGGEYGA
jgi:hypothetical protein